MAGFNQTSIRINMTMTFLARLRYVALLLDTMIILCYERSGSGVELRTLDYENPGSNPGCGIKTLGKFFHSTLFQFTQLNKRVPGYTQWWICVRGAFAH